MRKIKIKFTQQCIVKCIKCKRVLFHSWSIDQLLQYNNQYFYILNDELIPFTIKESIGSYFIQDLTMCCLHIQCGFCFKLLGYVVLGANIETVQLMDKLLINFETVAIDRKKPNNKDIILNFNAFFQSQDLLNRKQSQIRSNHQLYLSELKKELIEQSTQKYKYQITTIISILDFYKKSTKLFRNQYTLSKKKSQKLAELLANLTQSYRQNNPNNK